MPTALALCNNTDDESLEQILFDAEKAAKNAHRRERTGAFNNFKRRYVIQYVDPIVQFLTAEEQEIWAEIKSSIVPQLKAVVD